MAKVVLDVPKEFMGLVDTWRATLDSMKATLDRTGGGKAVDYAEIERETSDQCRESEVATGRAVWLGQTPVSGRSSLPIDDLEHAVAQVRGLFQASSRCD